jgi:hypothetical protein
MNKVEETKVVTGRASLTRSKIDDLVDEDNIAMEK